MSIIVQAQMQAVWTLGKGHLELKSGGCPADTVLHWDQKCSPVHVCHPDKLVDLVGITSQKGRV